MADQSLNEAEVLAKVQNRGGQPQVLDETKRRKILALLANGSSRRVAVRDFALDRAWRYFLVARFWAEGPAVRPAQGNAPMALPEGNQSTRACASSRSATTTCRIRCVLRKCHWGNALGSRGHCDRASAQRANRSTNRWPVGPAVLSSRVNSPQGVALGWANRAPSEQSSCCQEILPRPSDLKPSKFLFSHVNFARLFREKNLHTVSPLRKGTCPEPHLVDSASRNRKGSRKSETTRSKREMAGWPWAVTRPGLPQIRTCTH